MSTTLSITDSAVTYCMTTLHNYKLVDGGFGYMLQYTARGKDMIVVAGIRLANKKDFGSP